VEEDMSNFKDFLKEQKKDKNKEEITEAMSRKDFVAVANILKTAKDRDEITEKIADLFATVNPRFDRERFMKAAK